MPRPREYDDDLRIRLLDAAARLLVAEGPAAVTTRRVASEVGTSTTAIYSLIGSKDDLMHAVGVEGFHRLAAHLSAVPRTGDALADLAQLGFAYFDMAIEHPSLYRVMFGTGASVGDVQGGVQGDDLAVAESTLLVLLDAVSRCIEDGWFIGTADRIAATLWALGHGLASLTISGLLGPPDEARRHMVDSFTSMVIGMNQQAQAQGGRAVSPGALAP